MSADSAQPVMFISHGAGPCWFMDRSADNGAKSDPFFSAMDKHSTSAEYMRNLQTRARLPRHPRAILVVSAHWEEAEFTVTTAAKPELYFDYYNFPAETYKLEWPVPGAPEVAERTLSLLKAAGFKCGSDSKRGLDHGVFIPLKLAYPQADIPVFQLSLKKGLSVEEHLKLGETLQPLSAEGVLIIGSGQSTHNTGGPVAMPDWSERFRVWFHDVMTNPDYSPEERKRRILAGKDEPSFDSAHSRIEHYLPAIISAAAGGYRAGTLEYEENVGNRFLMSYIRFNGLASS